MILIIENQYLANIYLYLISFKSSNIQFEQYETFQKLSFRNRCIVAGANGPISLSIPLEKGREQKLLVKNVKIANRYSWQEQHWRTIQSCYSRSPWFEFYRDDLKRFYETHYEFLFDWNLDLFNWVNKKLELDILAELTTSFQREYDDENYLGFRNRVLPKNYTHFPCPEYQQVFMEKTGFLPNLSILDLMFCMGKQSKNYMQKALEKFSLSHRIPNGF